MSWLRAALTVLTMLFALGLSPEASAAEAPPPVEPLELPPAVLLEGELVSPSLQARLLRERPLKPIAALGAGVGLGLVGGLVGGALGAPFLLVGLPVFAFTGTLGGALGATTGVWLYSGDAPYWWLGVGALVGMTAASVVQAGLLMVSLAAAVTIIGIPLAIVLVAGAVAVGLVAMPLGASVAARVHHYRPVPRVLFRDQDGQADASDPWMADPSESDPWMADPSESDPWMGDPWSDPAWSSPAAAAGWSGAQ